MGNRLLASIPSERIRRYEVTAQLHGIDVYELYRWNQKVSLALFEEIGIIEVAMRSAMARELVATYGIEWFNDTSILDSQALKSISKIPKLQRMAPNSVEAQGRVVASLTLDFWVKLLGAGSYFITYKSQEKIESRRIYDEILWKPALRRAFPEVGSLERSRVESLARNMRFARNRIAHHEHVIWGVPAVGQMLPDGREGKRIRVRDLQRGMFLLAGLIDSNLEYWLIEHSTLQKVIQNCPLPSMENLYI